MNWARHWLWNDFYVPVWPNIAASAILGIWALRRFIRIEKLHRQHHEKLDAIHKALQDKEEK